MTPERTAAYDVGGEAPDRRLIALSRRQPGDPRARPRAHRRGGGGLGAGPILRDAGPTALVAIVFGVVVTTVYVVGMIARRKPSIWRLGPDSALVLGAFLAR
ncbi:MAG: hypothetical protein AAGF90_07040 [Pseudomonadota bacterium]